MVLAHSAVHKLSGRGKSEPFTSSFVGFYFRHKSKILIYELY